MTYKAHTHIERRDGRDKGQAGNKRYERPANNMVMKKGGGRAGGIMIQFDNDRSLNAAKRGKNQIFHA